MNFPKAKYDVEPGVASKSLGIPLRSVDLARFRLVSSRKSSRQEPVAVSVPPKRLSRLVPEVLGFGGRADYAPSATESG